MVEQEAMRREFEKQLLQSQIEVQEATYASLGKELHDNVGQLLSSAKMLIGITERKLTEVPDTLNVANDTLGKAISELRALSKTLSKEWLEQFNLIENLRSEVARINSSEMISLSLLLPPKIDLLIDEQIILFRIIQEGIQNALKHSGAKHLSVIITVQLTELKIEIQDDGNGFDASQSVSGIGILNMKHRVKILDGTIEWAQNNPGTVVTIILPRKNEQL